jgi:hypothetical protein
VLLLGLPRDRLRKAPRDSKDSFALIPAVRVASDLGALRDSPDSGKWHWSRDPRNPLKLPCLNRLGPLGLQVPQGRFVQWPLLVGALVPVGSRVSAVERN